MFKGEATSLPDPRAFGAIVSPRRSTRRTHLLSLLVVSVVVCGSACTADEPESPEVSATTAVAQVVAALELLETDPDQVAAEGVSEMVGDLREALPAGSKIDADPASWAPDGTGLGGVITVSVTAAGGPPIDYLVVMVNEPTGWKVLATFPEDESGAP